jgi:hypothetical protein
MSPDLAAEFKHLDTRLEAMIERIKEYSPEVQAAPVGKSYSPLKTLEHMFLVERDYAKMASAFDKIKFAGKTGKPSFMYRFVLKGMAKPANTAAPTIKKFSPDSSMSLEDSARQWRTERAKLVSHLSAFDDNVSAIKHPLFGHLSPRDVFIIQEKHQDYHEARLPK